MKLRTKLVAVLVVLAFVLGASLYGGLELYKDRVTESQHERASETATTAAAQVDAAVREKRDFVAFAASRPTATEFDQSDAYARDLVNDSRFYAVQIVAANGTAVAFSGDVTEKSRERVIGTNLNDQPYVREALDGRTHVSDPERASTGQHIIIVSAPIVDEGRIVGVLAAAMYLDATTLFTPVQPLPSDHRSVAVSAGSDILYRAGPSFSRNISAEARVESTGWTVEITRDRTTLDALLREVGVAQTVGVGVVLLVVSVVGGWQYRTTVSQMNRLQRAFDAARRGEYDYAVSLSGGDEWSDIAAGFDELLDELIAREEALERRRQRLEVLNRVLRHNLRTDVGVILGYADLILTDDDADTQHLARVIHRRADSLVEVGEMAREMQRLMVDRAVETGPIDVGSTLVDVVERVAPRFPAVRFETDVPSPTYAIATPQIGPALEQICENACEHNNAERPRVDVSLSSRDGERVRITVTDNGPGIPSSELEVLQRGRETPLDHGSGLGLWLIRWAVDGTDGDLTFESHDSGGTVVTIDLDAAEPSTEDRT